MPHACLQDLQPENFSDLQTEMGEVLRHRFPAAATRIFHEEGFRRVVE